MSFKIFLRDINVSNARNALYTLGSSSQRFPGDSISPNGSITRQVDNERSKTDLCSAATFETRKSSSHQANIGIAPTNLAKDLIGEGSKETQNAGKKIFMAAMICSWRKQRQLIKELTEKLQELKRNTMKNNHRIHVYEKMYDNEKERNYDLKNKLRGSQEELRVIKARHDSLAESNITLKASVSLLEQQLSVREEQYEGLQVAFNEIQTALFRSMSKERELQRQLSEEQRRVQSYIVRENDLIEKIQEFKKCDEFKEQNLFDQMSFKQLALMRYKEDNHTLSHSVNALLSRKYQIDSIDSRIQNTLNDILQIRKDIEILRQRLENSWFNRFKNFWHTTTLIRRRVAETILTIAYCILPSMPMPPTNSITVLPLRIGYI